MQHPGGYGGPPPGAYPPPPPPNFFVGGGRGAFPPPPPPNFVPYQNFQNQMLPPPPPPPFYHPQIPYGAENVPQPNAYYDLSGARMAQYNADWSQHVPIAPKEEEKDPWLEVFEKKHEGLSKLEAELDRNVEWSPLQMKLRAKRILVALDRIQEIQEEIQLLKGAPTDNAIFKSIQQKRLDQLEAESVSLRQQIEEDMKPFRDTQMFACFKSKILDSQRKQRKKREKNQKAKERRREDEKLRPTMHRLVDEWLVAEAAVVEQKEIADEKKEREQQRSIRKEKKERQRRELAMLIAKLEQLRRVRLRRQMPAEYGFEEQDGSISALGRDYFEIAKNVAPNSIETQDDSVPQASDAPVVETTSAAESTAAAVAAAARDADLPDSDDEDEDGKVKLEDLDAEFNEPLHFYYQAYESLDNLINVRRQWDSFLVAPRTGSRIPSTFIAPPDPPTSEVWAQYLASHPQPPQDDPNRMEVS